MSGQTMKHNPNTVITVALSYAEIAELLEACRFASPANTDFDNTTFISARDKLRRVTAPIKVKQA